jgi:hypothetical protein
MLAIACHRPCCAGDSDSWPGRAAGVVLGPRWGFRVPKVSRDHGAARAPAPRVWRGPPQSGPPYDVDETITRMPTHDETDRLGIQRGTPVAEHRRVGYTAEDRPVRLMISVPGDTIALGYVVVT